MKIRALATVAVIVAAMTGPCFAFENSNKSDLSAAYVLLAKVDGGLHADRLIQNVTCDPNGDGKQANCMRDCDEEEIRSRTSYGKETAETAKVNKKACEAKCGC